MGSEMKELTDEIKSEFQSQKTQLDEKMNSNQVNFQMQINEIKSNIECSTNRMESDLQRITKLNELKISGIAYKNDEKLNEIFGEIAKLVQFNLSNTNNIPTLTRIYRRNTTTNTSAPTSIVIAKFVANHIRNDFYRLYLNKIAAKPIMSQKLGLPEGTRIIIGENLTSNNFEIFVEAGKLKKDGKLIQVFTQDGLVQVKATKDKKAVAIRSLEQLKLFILENPPMASKQTNGMSGNNNSNINTNNNKSNAANEQSVNGTDEAATAAKATTTTIQKMDT